MNANFSHQALQLIAALTAFLASGPAAAKGRPNITLTLAGGELGC